MLVAVYGSLKRGYDNHNILADAAQYLGAEWVTGYQLFDLDPLPYPGARAASGDKRILCEIYRVSNELLKLLDDLEDFFPETQETSEYIRTEVLTSFGKAWIYLYNRDVTGKSLVKAGSW
jgi:gamma-glutamylcyclotransferase (GGCT)/AIG2-like uncharacterized protein YtfP